MYYNELYIPNDCRTTIHCLVIYNYSNNIPVLMMSLHSEGYYIV